MTLQLKFFFSLSGITLSLQFHSHPSNLRDEMTKFTLLLLLFFVPNEQERKKPMIDDLAALLPV